MNNSAITVVVLGASNKPDRYSNKAVKLLKEHGYHVIPVHPRLSEIDGLPVAPNLTSIKEKVHTLTLYIGPQRSVTLADDIIALNPGRVIFNPGAESDELESLLTQRNIAFFRACTLVLLRTDQF